MSEFSNSWWGPPLPWTLKALTGEGSAKNACKILSAKWLEVIIFITKDLRRLLSPRVRSYRRPYVLLFGS